MAGTFFCIRFPFDLNTFFSLSGWVLQKPRPARYCLVFENPQVADKWFDQMTKHTQKGTSERQFGLPLWMLEARGEALPQVFMDCVRTSRLFVCLF